jgi:hypothetical protein
MGRGARSVMTLLTTVLVSTAFTSCARDPSEMNLVIDGLRRALGASRRPELVNIIVYAPRTTDAPPAMPVQDEPGWDPSREARRIASWNGEDILLMPVAWWPSATIDALRVQAVVATGVCASERTVLAEGTTSGLRWMSGDDREVRVTLRATAGVIRSSASVSCQ